MSTKNNLHAGGVKPRLHRFPPLRKAGSLLQEGERLTSAEYQKQLQKGFEQGIGEGFAKGMEEGKDEGYQEGVRLGYDDGMSKGRIDGRIAGKSAFNDAIRPFSLLFEKMQEYQDSYENRRRDELLQLVEKVTHQVIRCELSLQPTQLLALVEEALAGLPLVPKHLKVYLNPEELARINDVAPENVKKWGLVSDPEMAPGECRIVTDTTEMDVGCQHRLDQCMDALSSNLLTDSSHD